MLPVEQPFKTYTGKDGKPLNNGYVYFGQPNQNPITAPVTVFWDAEGTIPAMQPLRTVNGYIMRAGTPANVFFEGSYSELVRDSKQRQVFYAKNSDEFSIATFISGFFKSTALTLLQYLPSWSGAISRSLQDLFSDRLSVMTFMTSSEKADVRNGTTQLDVSGAIQRAIDYVNTLPYSNKPTIFFPAGRYGVTKTIKLYPNIALVGELRDIGYSFGFTHSSEIIALSPMGAMVDITGSNVLVQGLGFYGNNSADYALYTSGSFGRTSSNTIRNVAVTLCKKAGIYMDNSGITKIHDVQVSNCTECGIDVSGFGDADFSELYINTINVDSGSTNNDNSTVATEGVGIRLRGSSGNMNIRGGKVEFCRIGILINGSQGINITGVNFDTCRKASVYINSDGPLGDPLTVNQKTSTSIQISGCRFLGALVGSQGSTAHIIVNYARYVTITGCGFKRSDDAAADFFGTLPAMGPKYGIWLYNAELCTVVGNNLHGSGTVSCLLVEHATPALAQHTIGDNSMDNTENITAGTIRTAAKFGSEVYSAGSNPVAASTAKAWVKFSGINNTIISSYNVASVTGTGGNYSVNWAIPIPNAVVAASVRNWYSAKDSVLLGTSGPNGVSVLTYTDGVASSNGEISVVAFG